MNSTIRRITPAGVVTTIAGSAGQEGYTDGVGSAARFTKPAGVAVDASGVVYVADFYSIRKITSDGTVSTFAGLGGTAGFTDGTGSDARFYGPGAIAFDPDGNLLVTDTFNHAIRRITPTGDVTTAAGGSPNGMFAVSGDSDGEGTGAHFFNPNGIAVSDVGGLYVADSFNNLIRYVGFNGAVRSLRAGVDPRPFPLSPAEWAR